MRVPSSRKLDYVFLDFETFWSVDFTLRKIPMGDYVRDPRFKIHCVAAKLNKGKTRIFYDMDKFAEWLDTIDWDKTALVGQNLYFDGLILSELFGISPAAYYCTMSMSRGLWRMTCAHNLDALAKRLGLAGKVKKEALLNTKGIEVLPKPMLKQLGEYCIDDVDDTAASFYIMLDYMPPIEMEIISHTVRCFTEPLLEIDEALLIEAVEEVEQRRMEMLDQIGGYFRDTFPEITDFAKALRSRTVFPEMLRSLGVEPPLKVSPTTGKPTYAFASKDPEFLALLEDEDPVVRILCETRAEFSSNQSVTRANRLLSATKGGATLPVMYLYCGAHTMRWSASGKMNLQNLQRGSKLRRAILAPEGYVLMVGDSAQIEARFTAWVAGQDDLVEAFRENRDVYSEFASDVFGYTVVKCDEQEQERFVGKTCILGLGFGMGYMKLYIQLFLGGVELPVHEVKRINTLYRVKYDKIPLLWATLDRVLASMAAGGSGTISLANGELVLEYEPDKIWMPNGLALHYPGLRPVFDEEGKHRGYEFMFVKGTRADGSPIMFPKKIYGGLLAENIVQCLARIAVSEQMVFIARGYRVVMTTHDEIVMLVKNNEKSIEKAQNFMEGVMGTSPDWCASLPVSSEVKYALNYSK